MGNTYSTTNLSLHLITDKNDASMLLNYSEENDMYLEECGDNIQNSIARRKCNYSPNNISLDEKEEILTIMKNRHGYTFTETFNDITLNKDYSKYPTQVLMKHSIPKNLIDNI